MYLLLNIEVITFIMAKLHNIWPVSSKSYILRTFHALPFYKDLNILYFSSLLSIPLEIISLKLLVCCWQTAEQQDIIWGSEMKPDNQSERWVVWPEGSLTPLSSVNAQLNIEPACPHTLYSRITHWHRQAEIKNTHGGGGGNIAVKTLQQGCRRR